MTQKQLLKRAVRPRVLIYIAILLLLIGGLALGVGKRTVMRMVVERDARVIARVNEDGLAENVYKLQLSNTSEKTHTIKLSVSGVDGIKLAGKPEVELDPASTDMKIVIVRVDQDKARAAGATDKGFPIVVHLSSPDTGDEIDGKSIYYLPNQ